MKIAVRGGHTFSVPGAAAYLKEINETRRVRDSVIKYLKALGHTVIDVTPPESYNTASSELSYGVNKANNSNVDLFISIHFNKAYDSYNGALGTEVLVYNAGKSNTEAKGVLNKLVALGFKNRGIKERTGLYELRATTMKSMIVEVCFVEATKDVELYLALGHDVVGKAIAEGAVNGKIDDIITPPKPPVTNNWVLDLQKELNKNYGANLVLDGIAGPKTLSACPLLKEGDKGNLVKIVQKRFIALNYSCGSYGADGVFGSGTKNATKAFQKNKGLSQDGIIGNNTWSKLLNL